MNKFYLKDFVDEGLCYRSKDMDENIFSCIVCHKWQKGIKSSDACSRIHITHVIVVGEVGFILPGNRQ
jgi:hypothetical protein